MFEIENEEKKKRQNDMEEFLDKVHSFSNFSSTDLSSGEDLSIAVMNLISIEEHLYFTTIKTNKKAYLEILKPIRAMRSKLLKELINQPEGEVWCISKHLLASSMRLIEVGTKYLANGKENDASEKFEQAFDLYSLFWSLNLNQNSSKGALETQDRDLEVKQKKDAFSSIREMVKKIVDCCKE